MKKWLSAVTRWPRRRRRPWLEQTPRTLVRLTLSELVDRSQRLDTMRRELRLEVMRRELTQAREAR